LMIKNPGVAPVEGFTVFGVSTSRGNDAAIGQFGSGNKHAINLLLRHGLGPQIFCGLDSLQFFTKPRKMDDGLDTVEYNAVHLNHNGEIKDLGFAVEYGELDWGDLAMAMREFVSNAIDRTTKEYGTHNHDKMVVDVVDSPVPKDECTTVYIPWCPDVQRFYNELSQRFLHFKGDGSHADDPLIINEKRDEKGRIYRRGVFIRPTNQPAFFHYNFDNSLKIDEARNLDDYVIRRKSGNWALAHATTEQLTAMFSHITEHGTTLESRFTDYDLELDDAIKYKVRMAWEEIAQGAILVNTMDGYISEHLARKGHRAVVAPSDNWFKILTQCGVPTYAKVLSSDEKAGITKIVATPAADELFNSIWNRLWGMGFMSNIDQPAIQCFTCVPTDGDAMQVGFYERKTRTICINKAIADGKNEELAAVILGLVGECLTGSKGSTDDIKNFALAAAVKMGEFISG